MTNPATDFIAPRLASIDSIRAQFPALERLHHGQPVAYFDGPGGTQVPRAVVNAMADYLHHHNANTHWNYPTSAETDDAISRAREAVADFLNATPSEIAFGANMTTLTFHLGRALARGWQQGDEIVVTELDHHANVDTWHAVARERGLVVRTVAVRPEPGEIDWRDLSRQLTARTRLLAIGAASNAIGTITDVARAADLAHNAGALVFVDAVHYAAHELVDVRAFDCDFLACSAYKFYGPHIGILFGRQTLAEALEWPKLRPAPDAPPECIETGTQNHEGIVGTAAAIEFLASLADVPEGSRRQRLAATFGGLHARGQALVQRLWDGLHAIRGVKVFGPPPDQPRTPTVSFSVARAHSDNIAIALAERGVFVSNGDFYATTLVERLGQAACGVVRAGCACYTTTEEVVRLIDNVAAVHRTGDRDSNG
jgi:cysteine desulfurase family protein (TIGR01976 family)